MRRSSIFAALAKPPIITGKKVKLRPKRLEDAANDYAWRKDAELCRLDAAPLIQCSFEEFLKNYLEDLHRFNQSYRFGVETPDGKHIGNCSYFSLDGIKKEAEMGIMIGNRDYWNLGYGADVIITSLNYFFTNTNMRRIHLKTLSWNSRAQKCFQKCGFVPCGQVVHGEYTFLLMETYSTVKTRAERTGGQPQVSRQRPASGR